MNKLMNGSIVKPRVNLSINSKLAAIPKIGGTVSKKIVFFANGVVFLLTYFFIDVFVALKKTTKTK